MTQKTMLAWGLGLLVIVVAGIAVWQSERDDEDLSVSAKIGALLPFTGNLAAFGETTLSGIELAVMEVNEAGGVIGGQLQLITADTETNPQAGVVAAQKLAGVDQVSGIVGAMASGVTIPIAQSVAAVTGVPTISPSATSPVITGLDDGDYLFRTTPHDAAQGVLLAKLVADEGIERVAVLFRNDDYGKGLAESFADNYAGEITSMIGYEPDQASYDAEIAQSAAGGETDALVMISFPEEGIPILRHAIESGAFDRFVFTDGMKANDVVAEIGQQYLETSFGTAPEAGASERLERYRALYEEKIGAMPTDRPFIENAYDAAILLALAIEQAGVTDPAAVRDALRAVANPPGEVVMPGEFAKAKQLIADGVDINYEGAAGAQDFDDAGDVGGTFSHWMFRDGTVRTIAVLGD